MARYHLFVPSSLPYFLRLGAGRDRAIGREVAMPKQWMALVMILGLATTLLNLAILAGQIATPANARAGAGKLLNNEDFTDGLTKIIRKTVRDYCTVGKRSSIDC
ncbi:MAG TPA: hypothetical protein VGM00_13910 [Bradyrhizobium sp.]|jgi:hypothetical protein